MITCTSLKEIHLFPTKHIYVTKVSTSQIKHMKNYGEMLTGYYLWIMLPFCLLFHKDERIGCEKFQR